MSLRYTPLLALGALFLAGGSAPALAAQRCDTRRVTSNSTTPLFDVSQFGTPITASLKITTAGGGTVSVAVNVIGPTTASGGEDLATDRATALLGTLNAATTFIGTTELTPSGLEAVVTGCTSCVIFIGLCAGSP